ncbi:23S rRNA (cytidine(2498)-2'-O)-methyltransferase RlmM [Marinimicrobium alkaliphilum]|uniref:23S rRNA (cytidine(2498)-2'-O)-methyltransferase RlmM n=1 Tax=Marinimicrobium alkaliphilum TaxID=2202654 RepID=UPI000DB9B088|nr:23S rRNA (cytidine(2498)-2'-O)-methyltransferase RlmM [Marinimicrobium alkaliphilum]
MNHLFLHCRPGFEKECASEIAEIAADAGVYGFPKAREGDGYVLYVTHEPDGAVRLMSKVDFHSLVFTRQWFGAVPLFDELPVSDRIGPLLTAAIESLPVCGDLWIETVDTNLGKEMSGLSKKFIHPFRQALKKAGRLSERSSWRLHLVFMSGTQAWLGAARIPNSAVWPMGIARLRLPRAAPSRATLKLEEAWHHFIPANEWDERLCGGLKAVDLGAAPGGWTWQLVQRGMFVDAVDNGPMDPVLMESGQVRHLKSDGFVYEPRKAVYWLVCDIADKPARVTSLIGKWVAEGYCREAIFNLKLPMKQRYAEVKKLEQRLQEKMAERDLRIELRFKQLYHDREEVTGHLRVLTPAGVIR